MILLTRCPPHGRWRVEQGEVQYPSGKQGAFLAACDDTAKGPLASMVALCLIPGGMRWITDGDAILEEWFVPPGPQYWQEARLMLMAFLDKWDAMGQQMTLPGVGTSPSTKSYHVGPNGGIVSSTPVGGGYSVVTSKGADKVAPQVQAKKMNCPRCQRDRTIYEPKCWWCGLDFPDNVPF